MKIIIVEHRFHYSGPVAQRLLAYSRAFMEKGHHVVMILSSQTPLPVELDGIRIIEIQESKKHIIKCYSQFVRNIKREYTKDSVIFFYEPQIYTVLFRSPKYRTFSEQTEIPNYGYKASFLQRVIERVRLSANRHFNGMAVISKGLKDYYKKKGIKNIEVINMFVDSSRFEKVQVDTKDKYIAYCGTISIHKDGVDTLIKAFDVFRKSFPEYKLYLIGDFDQLGSEDIIKGLIDEFGLGDSVVLTGRVNADDMPKMLMGAQMLALSRPNNTQAQYGFPTKLGEYLATGKPVVVTKVGEIPLFLHDGENAFMANPDNVTGFANKLIEVASDYPTALKVSQKGKELAYTEFSSKVQSDKLLDFIRHTI